MNFVAEETYAATLDMLAKQVLSPHVYHDGKCNAKALTKKELLEAIDLMPKRAIGMNAVGATSRIYTDGRIAFKIGPGKVNDQLHQALVERAGEINTSTSLTAESMVKVIEQTAEACKDREHEIHIMGVSDYGYYLVEIDEDNRAAVDCRLFETMRTRCKKCKVYGTAFNAPLVFRNDDGEWQGVLLPIARGDEGQPDADVFPEDRWNHFGFQEFDICSAEFDKPRRERDRPVIYGRITEPWNGFRTSFEIKRYDESWCIYIRTGSGPTDTFLLADRDTKAAAMETVETVTKHIASIAPDGKMNFNLNK